jgi:leader peptidase (prepilin peptidase)/N-methyltransferase
MTLLFVFVAGLFIGSFLNVLADRLSRGESAIGGRSYCEKCKKTLKWHDLVPLLSFIFLGGKCRYCHVRLSLYYPIIELTTGIMFVLALSISGFNIYGSGILNYFNLIYFIFLFSALVVIFFADLK